MVAKPDIKSQPADQKNASKTIVGLAAFAGVSLARMAQRLGLMHRRLDGLRDDLGG